MRITLRAVALVVVCGLGACGTANGTTIGEEATSALTPVGNVAVPSTASAALIDAGTPPRTDADADAPRTDGLRVMTANISSGKRLDYGPIEGVRIFQGLRPDVVLVQEFKSGSNSTADVDAYVASTFGATFTYYREPDVDLPNGVISRFPILESGHWVDPQVSNRSFVYAKIAVPGARPLWAVSVHLLTTGGSQRTLEATALVAKVKTVVPASDYLVVGGDFNTGGRNETCMAKLREILVADAPFPSDGSGGQNTNTPRSKPFDWVLPDVDLASRQVPLVLGQRTFPSGLVFDSRVYTPLADVAPIEVGDSASLNMQHMPVVREFRLTE